MNIRMVYRVALVSAVVCAMGCKSKSEDASPKTVKAEAPQEKQASPPPEPGRTERLKEIFSQSLNGTVKNTDRFLKAPHYELSMEIDYELFTYTGKEVLHYTNNEKDTLKKLNFAVYPNTPELATKGTLNLSVKNVKVDGKAAKHTMKGPGLSIELPTPLPPGERIKVTMDFTGAIYRLEPSASDMQKLAMQQLMQMVMGESATHGGYGVFSVGDGIVSLGLWYPILTAYDEKGWDMDTGTGVGDVSYFDVANYELSVTAPSDVVVVASGVETGRKVSNGKQTTKIVAGAVREVTIQMSREYVASSQVVDGVKVSSWYLKEHAGTGKEVLGYGAEALKLFNSVFGPYPYTELDIVEAPLVGGAGGVEFPGLVTIAKMFYADMNAKPDDVWAQAISKTSFIQETLEFVVAHEVAHEWWNAVVGSDSKRHPFVDEALANHSAILYFRRVHGEKAANKQIELQLKLPFQMALMVGAKDRPVDLPTAEFNSMMEYAAVVYGKGGLFFDAMRREFGDAAQLKFLKAYYKKHAFGIATTKDLIGGMIDGTVDRTRAQVLADRWLKGTYADKDIGPVKIGTLFKYLAGDMELSGPMKRVVELLDHKGTAELTKLVKHFMDSDGTLKEDVNYGSIIKLLGELLNINTGDTPKLVEMAMEFLTKNPKLLSGEGDPQDLLKSLARFWAGNDEKTNAMIDATDALIRILTAE